MSKEGIEYRLHPCYRSWPMEKRAFSLRLEVMSRLPYVLHVLAHHGISIITESMNKLVKISLRSTEYIL